MKTKKSKKKSVNKSVTKKFKSLKFTSYPFGKMPKGITRDNPSEVE